MEAMETSTKCCPLKQLVQLLSSSLRYEKNHFLIKLRALRLQLYLKKHPSQKWYFSKILNRDSEKLHFRIAFCSTLTFAEHHSTITLEAKYETAIHNSPKCFFSHQEIKTCFSSHKQIQLKRNLTTKILFNKKNKQTIVLYPFSFQ